MSVFNVVLMGVSICITYRTITAMHRIRYSKTHKYKYIYIYVCWLVVSTPLKNISQLGSLFPVYGK